MQSNHSDLPPVTGRDKAWPVNIICGSGGEDRCNEAIVSRMPLFDLPSKTTRESANNTERANEIIRSIRDAFKM